MLSENDRRDERDERDREGKRFGDGSGENERRKNNNKLDSHRTIEKFKIIFDIYFIGNKLNTHL